nr:hypothetical protein C5F59_39680 [Streptomyces sp. QL37]
MTSQKSARAGCLPAPSGCRWCGIEARSHARQWVEAVGWHVWETPTDEQRKERMRARRGQLPMPGQ